MVVLAQDQSQRELLQNFHVIPSEIDWSHTEAIVRLVISAVFGTALIVVVADHVRLRKWTLPRAWRSSHLIPPQGRWGSFIFTGAGRYSHTSSLKLFVNTGILYRVYLLSRWHITATLSRKASAGTGIASLTIHRWYVMLTTYNVFSLFLTNKPIKSVWGRKHCD